MGVERSKFPKMLVFLGKRHDNKILKVQILLSWRRLLFYLVRSRCPHAVEDKLLMRMAMSFRWAHNHPWIRTTLGCPCSVGSLLSRCNPVISPSHSPLDLQSSPRSWFSPTGGLFKSGLLEPDWPPGCLRKCYDGKGSVALDFDNSKAFIHSGVLFLGGRVLGGFWSSKVRTSRIQNSRFRSSKFRSS